MGMFSELKKMDDKKQEKKEGKQSPTLTTSPKTTKSQATNKVNQSINQPVNKSINLPIDTSQVIAKPKGFYITKNQDEDLDEAVKKLNKRLEGKVMVKIDRSTILRLLIEEANLTKEETIERLSNQLINRLINQLTNK
jgi:hypothetical protein